MITNPHLPAAVQDERRRVIQEALEDPDFLDKRGRIRVKRLTKYDDPQRFDRDFESVIREVRTTVVDVDAKLVEGNRVRHYRSAQEFLRSPLILQRLERARANGLLTKDEKQLAEHALEQRMKARQLREGSDFEYGLYPDEAQVQGRVFPITDVALPYLNSPHAKNALFVDYLDAHRKCLAGDTPIPLADGSSLTLAEMAARGPEATFWVYACRDGMVHVAQARSARQTGVMEVFDVVLDNGQSVRATATHPFMLRDGSYRTVADLRAGDRLMPLYVKRKLLSGKRKNRYEQVYHPVLDLWEYTHHLVARTHHTDKFFFGVWDDIDHVDEVNTDNSPENIQLLTRREHMVKTAAHPERRAFAVLLGKRKRTLEDKVRMSVAQRKAWADPEVRAKRLAGLQRAWADPAKKARMYVGLNRAGGVPGRKWKAKNHRVVAIRPVGIEPVYDLTVPGFANFAVGQGVFVHNCFEAATFNPIAKRICLSGDTIIPLLDGSSPTIRELVARGEQEVWVYACHEGQVVPAKTSQIALTGYRPVLAIELDNGEVIKATADHPFMLRSGAYRDAGDLQVGDRLMPLYRRQQVMQSGAYERVWHPDLGLWEYTHRLVARTALGLMVDRPSNPDIHVHHANDCSTDNRPENLQVLSQRAHVTETSRREKNKAIKRQLPQSQNFGGTIRQLWKDPAWRAQQQAKFRQAANPAQLSARARANWADPEKRTRLMAGMRKRPKLETDPKTGRFLKKNHRVVSVRPVGVEPVYDLTVPDFQNFAVGAGVFVHNCKIIPQFVLGRGVKGIINSRDHQRAWDEFYKRNRMRQRVYQSLKEIVMYGEIFWRFFPTRNGLVVRSLDPSTIWDIVTDDDDIEDIKYYHQQYVRLDISPIPGRMPVPSTMVIRQIPADEVAHYKVNATTSEKRGRSELFSILGYLLRFKEFLNDRILLNKMRAMFALDVAVQGDEADVNSAEEQFSQPPGPGAVMIHNAAVEVEFKNASTAANDAQTDAETILKVIAIGAGVSENFLGVARAQTRAGALISTEPDVKNFEDYQQLIEEILMDTAERVFKAKGLTADRLMEFTFPSIAQEDRSAKLKDIALMESMDYFSKERAATMAAREFQISDYDYAAEQQQVVDERGESPVISSPFQQVSKIAPAEGGDQPPALGADLQPNKAPKDGVTQLSAQMGFKGDGGGRGLANTQATLNRPGFTRGGEKTALKNNRTSGTPLRHAAEQPRRSGWSDAARAKSLATRRARAELRKREQTRE